MICCTSGCGRNDKFRGLRHLEAYHSDIASIKIPNANPRRELSTMSNACTGEGLSASDNVDPFRHTCLIPYVDPTTAPAEVAEKIKVLPFRRNIFLLLGHSKGLFPPLMGLIGGCFNGKVRGVHLLDWVRPLISSTL